jgi:hypothetical protein
MQQASYVSAQAPAQYDPAPSKIELEVDTITPQFVKDFQNDYATFSADKFMKWISPKRGLVEDGILMTFDLTKTKMKDVEKEMSGLKPSMYFIRGYYNGLADVKKFYKAFYQLSFKAGKADQRINLIAVFEKIDSQWYLVQSHSLKLSRDTLRSGKNDALALQTNLLTIGDFPFEFEGKTYVTKGKARQFSSKVAKNRKRPVLLNFFTRISGDFGAQLDWAESLYPKFQGRNIYFFCVTDDELDFLTPYLDDGKWKLAVLLDEKSLIHHDLEIDIHPFIMLIDHSGVVRCISRGYNKESLGLVEKITLEIIDEANRSISLETKDGPPKHK